MPARCGRAMWPKISRQQMRGKWRRKRWRKKEITPWVYYVQSCDTLWLSALVWHNGERGRKTWRLTEERPHCVHIVQPCVASPQFTSYPCTVSQFFPKGLPILIGLVPFLSKCLSMENHWPSFGESKGLGMYELRLTCFTVYPMHRTVNLWNPKCIFKNVDVEYINRYSIPLWKYALTPPSNKM